MNIPTSDEELPARLGPQDPLAAEAFEETLPVAEPTEAGASRQVRKKSKRQELVRKSKRVILKRPRLKSQAAIAHLTERVEGEAEPQSEDDIPLLQRHVRSWPEPSASTTDTLLCLAIEIFTPPLVSTLAVASSTGQLKLTSSSITPSSSFARGKNYGVSKILESFLTILKDSPSRVLGHGEDFTGIKVVQEALLNLMQSLTNYEVVLPYRLNIVKVEDLIRRW
ncbi:uncharacterized protein A4U43_C10F14610 [Asparagus officinalis]|uniref:Uncharacterized protein n=1 Tax=Asparagus officinalis TaxID=4686 RepID=A0A5P1E603_ASPOF|nr:uncharacterized protein A4U43_C10F14610 [Asparagus officinalis]